MNLSKYVADKSIRRRFLAKVAFCKHGKSCTKCCWLYDNGTHKNPYGSFYVCTLSFNPKRKLIVKPCRFIWNIVNGHTDNLILHTCDIPACCNYHHLFDGTQKDNMQDKVNKNRQIKGEKHYRAKLTRDTVLYMFALRELGFLYKDIALIVGVHRTHASEIIRAISWKHVTLL